MLTVSWFVVASMGAAAVTLGIRDLYRHLRDERRRINAGIAELQAQPIDYWPVFNGRIVEITAEQDDEGEWYTPPCCLPGGRCTPEFSKRAVWPITNGAPE